MPKLLVVPVFASNKHRGIFELFLMPMNFSLAGVFLTHRMSAAEIYYSTHGGSCVEAVRLSIGSLGPLRSF